MFTPVLGILIGATLTLIIVICLIILRIRKTQNSGDASPLEHKTLVGSSVRNQNTLSSTKPLLRSFSPRDIDDKDPDVIPAKFGEYCLIDN